MFKDKSQLFWLMNTNKNGKVLNSKLSKYNDSKMFNILIKSKFTIGAYSKWFTCSKCNLVYVYVPQINVINNAFEATHHRQITELNVISNSKKSKKRNWKVKDNFKS